MKSSAQQALDSYNFYQSFEIDLKERAFHEETLKLLGDIKDLLIEQNKELIAIRNNTETVLE